MNKLNIHNPELELAWNFVENTDKSIFLTGKAGTGKTTFLHQIKAKSLKRMIVVAPTGVAAINAKGVTIHSFFQLPFGPIIPDGSQFQQRGNYKMRFARQKIDIIKSLDLLIIDEISMVRADLLDGIDQVLRRYKDRDKVFGGLQVLMIGDLQQLAPVVKPNEWSLLAPYYQTVFFFSSRSFQQAATIGIELQHIYRQDNQEFIEILNEIRNNKLSQNSANELNKCYIPNFIPEQDAGYITLTTHNNRAHIMNNAELLKLSGSSFYYEAEIKGTFNEHAFPTQLNLELKIGAQVMFIKNDSSPEKRYFNGKIGKVIRLDATEVVVQCPEDNEPIITTPEIWENVKYTIDPNSKEIAEDFVGSFAQIPLRLAWAITIHKSQGLTFDKAIIDAEASFTHGQTYVALSRCRTLEGMVLKTRITPNSIISDQVVDSYIKQVQDNPPTSLDLQNSQKAYQLNLIADLYDFSAFVFPLKRCLGIYYKNRNSLEGNILEPLNIMLDSGVNALTRVNSSFKKQLLDLVSNIEIPEKSEVVQARLIKANVYFIEQTNLFIKTPLGELTFSTDNKETTKNLNKQIEVLEELLASKLYCLKALSEGFSSKGYLQLRAEAVLQDIKPSKTKKDIIDSTEHPELFESLRVYRMSISQSEEILPFQIFSQQTLFEMCRYFPITAKQLKAIHGMGKVRVEKYAEGIIEIISEYAEKHKLEPIEADKKSKKSKKSKKPKVKKGETQRQSLVLFQDGLTIAEIAQKRGYVKSTIEGHLAQFVPTGEILITELMSKDRYELLKSNITGVQYEGLNDLKTKLKDEYHYGELKMAIMAMEYEVKNQ